MRAADAPAQLVQLRKAELVGAAHDDGIGRRHVDACLDDGRAQQQVVALRDEVAHHVLELALGHLAMGDGDARLGQQLLQLGAACFDGLHLVVQEVDLAAALELAQHGLADGAGRFVAHEGLDRQALLRRGGNDREIAQAFQRHAERARNRRRRQRQHIDLGAQGFQRFLLPHAETVFLVDDHQAQARELDVIRQQFVGADHDIERAVGHALDRLRDFLA